MTEDEADRLPDSVQLEPGDTVSIIIPHYNTISLLENCLISLQASNFPKTQLEIIVVDNASVDDSKEIIRTKYPEIKLIENDSNIGFGPAINVGVQHAVGRYLVFLGNDTRADKNWLHDLIRTLKSDEQIGAVGPLTFTWDGGQVAYEGRRGDLFGLPPDTPYEASNAKTSMETWYVEGGSMMIRKDVFQSVKGFDDDYFMYYADVDLGWRLWLNGYSQVIVPTSLLYHKVHGSARKLSRDYLHQIIQRNIFFTAFKNLSTDGLKRYFPLLFYVTLGQNTNFLSGRQTFLNAVWAFQQSIEIMLPKREYVQASRKISDADLFARAGHPFGSYLRHPQFAAVHTELLELCDHIVLEPLNADTVRQAIKEWLCASLYLSYRNQASELDSAIEHQNTLQATMTQLQHQVRDTSSHFEAQSAAIEQLQAQLKAVQHIAAVASEEVKSLHNAKFYRLASIFWKWRDRLKRK